MNAYVIAIFACGREQLERDDEKAVKFTHSGGFPSIGAAREVALKSLPERTKELADKRRDAVKADHELVKEGEEGKDGKEAEVKEKKGEEEGKAAAEGKLQNRLIVSARKPEAEKSGTTVTVRKTDGAPGSIIAKQVLNML